MKKIISILLSVGLGIGLAFGGVLAADENFLTPNTPTLFAPTENGLEAVKPTEDAKSQQVNLLFQGPQSVMRFLFGLFTLIGVLASIYAGSRIVFSQGDPKKMQQGFFMLLYTAIGFLIIGSAWFIIRFILNFKF